MFKNATTNTKQGDIGEARAIYEYTKLGFTVCRTIFDSAKYDLIIDDGDTLSKVQVRTTRFKDGDVYQATLKTCGGNQRHNTICNREDANYDVLFVLTGEDACWSIPIEFIKSRTSINLGKHYNKFKL